MQKNIPLFFYDFNQDDYTERTQIKGVNLLGKICGYLIGLNKQYIRKIDINKSDAKVYWLFMCICGSIKPYRKDGMVKVKPKAKSCGCKSKEFSKIRQTAYRLENRKN